MRTKNLAIAVLFGMFWISYVAAIVMTGWLDDLSLPPKFPLLIIAPFILFLVFFYRSQRKSQVISNIPHKWLIIFHTFRILVEVMLYFTFIEGVIPESATFDGNNFDIIMGISAPIVALTIYRNLQKNRRLAAAWNVLGILMILVVAVTIGTSMYAPQLWGSETTLVSMEFVEYPYFLIASLIAPGAIFVHVISLIQLRQMRDKP